MGIRYGKPHRVMKEPSRGWQECFAENHGSYGCGSNKSVPVIECLGSPADRPGEKALKIPGFFTIAIQPFGEIIQDTDTLSALPVRRMTEGLRREGTVSFR